MGLLPNCTAKVWCFCCVRKQQGVQCGFYKLFFDVNQVLYGKILVNESFIAIFAKTMK
jgi:hypothetical protein